LFTFISDPGDVARKAIVNYCQYLYSSAGSAGWYNNGCIICMDYPTTYNAFGTDWSYAKLFTSCSSTKAKSKLRFLADAATTGTTTTKDSTTQTATGQVIPNTIYNSAVVLSVCPVPYPICATDVSQGSKSYADLFATIGNELKTADKINTVLGIANVSVQTITTLTDAVAANISNVSIKDIKGDASGNISWTASATTPYLCFFKTQAVADAAPTAEQIKSCTDTAKCGSVNVITTATTGKVSTTAALASGDYKVYFSCQNNVPYATQNSAVTSVQFNVPAASGGSSVITSPTTSINSNNLTFGWMLILALVALLI
jgi:hypothetical protein